MKEERAVTQSCLELQFLKVAQAAPQGTTHGVLDLLLSAIGIDIILMPLTLSKGSLSLFS